MTGESQRDDTHARVISWSCSPAAGLRDIRQDLLTIRVRFTSFAEWWEPFTLGVGPGGAHLARLGAAQRDQLKQRCQALFPKAPFELEACAWVATGRA